ncbi:MAG: hypothetical protein GY754_04530 [bacterium]|nr:hypothetical protein [bacterium]
MNIVRSYFVFCLTVLVFAFSGCEQGLTQEDSSEDSSGGDFSFSQIYSRLNTMAEEIEQLKIVNEEQAAIIEALGGEQSSTAGSLTTRIETLETTVSSLSGSVTGLQSTVGNSSTGLVRDFLTLEGTVGSNSSAISALQSSTGSLNSLFSGVSRTGSTIQFSGVNVQIVNGSGSTRNNNGTGNLIIGYNETRTWESDDRTGSHNLVIGVYHNFSSHAGLVTGYANDISGPWASITSATYSSASGWGAHISAGSTNTVSGNYSSVTGGYNNTVAGLGGTIGGGNGFSVSGAYDWRAGDFFWDDPN